MPRKLTICCIEESIYPWDVGGAEIFDYYWLRNVPPHWVPWYLSTKIWPDKALNVLKVPSIKPQVLVFPLTVFFLLLRKHRQFDYIHLRYSRSYWFNWWPYLLLKKLVGLKYMITIHGGGLTPWKFNGFYRRMFREAGLVFGVSQHICEEYRKRSRRNVIPIVPLIPFRESQASKKQLLKTLGFNPSDRLILFVGSLKPLKNPGVIIDALIALGDRYVSENNLKAVFVGDGPLRRSLEARISNSFLENHVFFSGSILREEIPAYYKAADVYVIASSYEGTPLSLLEAMFNRLPIVASDAPGITAMLRHGANALLFKRNNAGDLAAGLQQFLDNPSMANRSAVQARKDFDYHYNYHAMMMTFVKHLDGNGR